MYAISRVYRHVLCIQGDGSKGANEGFVSGEPRLLLRVIFRFFSLYMSGATTVGMFSVISIILCGIEGEVFACRRDQFPLANTVDVVTQGVTF